MIECSERVDILLLVNKMEGKLKRFKMYLALIIVTFGLALVLVAQIV